MPSSPVSHLALALALTLCPLASSCGDDSDGGDLPDAGGVGGAALEGPWASFAERPCPPDSILTWENFGGAFVLEYCTGCHGRSRGEGERQMAPLMATFDEPASIRPLADRLWARAGDDNATMPPVGGPGAEDRRRFGEWLACGAPMQRDLE